MSSSMICSSRSRNLSLSSSRKKSPSTLCLSIQHHATPGPETWPSTEPSCRGSLGNAALLTAPLSWLQVSHLSAGLISLGRGLSKAWNLALCYCKPPATAQRSADINLFGDEIINKQINSTWIKQSESNWHITEVRDKWHSFPWMIENGKKKNERWRWSTNEWAN